MNPISISIDITCLQIYQLNSISRIPHSPDQLFSSISDLSEPERILHLISCTTPVFSPHCSDHLHKPGKPDNNIHGEFWTGKQHSLLPVRSQVEHHVCQHQLNLSWILWELWKHHSTLVFSFQWVFVEILQHGLLWYWCPHHLTQEPFLGLSNWKIAESP